MRERKMCPWDTNTPVLKYARRSICSDLMMFCDNLKKNISECCQQRLVAMITLFNIYYQWDDSGTVKMTPQFELDLCLVVKTLM